MLLSTSTSSSSTLSFSYDSVRILKLVYIKFQRCCCLIFCFTVGCNQLKHLKWFKERVSEIILYTMIITDVSFWQVYFYFYFWYEKRGVYLFIFQFNRWHHYTMTMRWWPHWFYFVFLFSVQKFTKINLKNSDCFFDE